MSDRSIPDIMCNPEDRILDRAGLACLREEVSGRIVFTNGCFDILHRGHVELLTCARELGDLLVVGLNSDESVRKLKGPGRPVTGEEDRAHLLLALRCVDFVTVFSENTPLETIKALRPDVLVKGAEYGSGEIVGEEFVLGTGGTVERFDMVEGRSSSSLIDRIRKSSAEK